MGVYTIDVIDANPLSSATTCTQTLESIGLASTVKVSDPSCSTSNDGQIVVTTNGKHGKIFYTVAKDGTIVFDNRTGFTAVETIKAATHDDGTSTTATFSELEPGKYVINIYDDYIDSDLTKATLSLSEIILSYQKALSVTEASHIDATCYGNSDGQITLTVTSSGITASSLTILLCIKITR